MLRAHSRAFVKPTLQYSRWQLSRLISSERSSSAGVPGVMAIRREDNSVWERRAPLAPKHVRKLVRSGVKVLVQPSNRRAYPMKSYSDIGAVIQEDISEASVVVGVKQVPIDLLLPDRTYVFFSHTIKAQESNMSMLDAVLEKNIRLIDYEKMCDESGQRTVAFGKYAGVAGMINILHGLGLRLLALGHHTPFMFIGPSHNYRNSSMAKQAIRDAGYEISLDMMPKSIGPLTFVFTGSGNVSQGAQEVFQELPHEYVEPKHLHKVAKHGSTNKLYVCVVRREDHLVHKEGKRFCPDEYDSHPERYVSTFSNKIAPHASVIINGIYWAPNSPRLISIPDAKNLLQPQSSPWLPQSEGCPHLPHKLLAICDISADPGGSMEFVRECTNIDSPFCLYDADDHMETESFKGNGVLVCSIDNMPTQIPRESTDFFGGLLLPYVSDMLKSDATSSFDEFDVSPVVKNAVIASNGKLTPNFEYINNLRRTSRSKHKAMKAVHEAEKRVLVLGSGFVAGPVIEYLTRDDKYHVTLVSDLKESADALANKFRNVEPMLLDTQRNKDEVEGLIKQHDLVISLLPYSLHAEICALCIKHTCNMVTASYCTPDMMRLHKHAIEAGITVVNEVGVDPGIDHMLAMECFDIARDAGGKVKSFVSYCGGLPAPEFSDNPLRYKFNWSPRGVLMNCLSGARYLKDGEVIDVPGEGHLLNVMEPKTFLPGFHLEGYPNRDSTIYGKLYDIESAHTIIRGTLRYRGFAEAAQALLDIGLLSLKAHPLLHPAGPDITWKDYLCNTFGTSMDILPDSLRELVFDRVDQEDIRMNCIEKLGLFEDTLIDKRHTPLDTLSNYLTKRLSYNAGERDLLIMRHEIDVEYPDGSLDREDINFVVYGDPNSYSAMAKTVGFPTGIAAKMVLEGEIQQKGMVLPLTRDIYRPILKRLKQEGIVANESKVMSNEAVPRVQAIV